MHTQQVNGFSSQLILKILVTTSSTSRHQTRFSSKGRLIGPWSSELTWQHPAQLAERSHDNNQ
jgi:hypothetical protein